MPKKGHLNLKDLLRSHRLVTLEMTPSEASFFQQLKEQEKGEAVKEAEEAINLAGWMKWLERGEYNPELNTMAEKALQNASRDIIERAKEILKNAVELVPETKPSERGRLSLVGAGQEWSEETQKAWIIPR